MVLNRLDDLRITQVRPLLPPAILLEEIPITDRASELVGATRQAIADVYVLGDRKLPWYIDLLNINLGVRTLAEAKRRIQLLVDTFRTQNARVTHNLDFS